MLTRRNAHLVRAKGWIVAINGGSVVVYGQSGAASSSSASAPYDTALGALFLVVLTEVASGGLCNGGLDSAHSASNFLGVCRHT